MIPILFFLFAGLAITGAILMVTHRNPVYSAIFLILTFFSLAGLYFLLGAQFLSVVQVIVYAGAIMVLFLFVIMLLNLTEEVRLPLGRPFQIGLGTLFAVILAAQFLIFVAAGSALYGRLTGQYAVFGGVENLGRTLFSAYLYPFEIASVLLLTGIVGAIILGSRKLPKEQ
ncbi:MAG TPA: NADH-quinone oxidoreductase subunit J [bacterium]|nr:NADH-quinone oxidoreductase subunit J [bacterium]HQI49925.1 NADH-quinone oxidoreductase subunit J [bacterium]HQJ63942.1 NADH-quinone oxidoreductase subunit J [bacterium]